MDPDIINEGLPFDAMDFSDENEESEDFQTDQDENEQSDENIDLEYMEIDDVVKTRGRPIGSTRRKETITGPVKRKKIPQLSLLNYVCFFCCAYMCLSCIQEESILALQENFNSLTKHEKSQYVLDWLWAHYSTSNGEYLFKFLIGTTSVCLSAWLAVLVVPSSTFYSIRKRFFDGQKSAHLQGRTPGRLSIQTLSCITWLLEYARLYAEKHPDTVSLDLPPCLTRKSVYQMMKEELNDQGVEVVSETYFISVVWKKYCSHIKIPPVSRFSKCDTCTLIKEQLAETKSKSEIKILFEKRRNHLEKQSQERQKYYKHCLKARKEPKKYLSIIIDGMDQKKTFLPNFVLLSKFTSGMWRLRTHLVGAIVHGVGIYGFFYLFQWSHSTNLTLSILVQIFSMLDDLPDVLYLQMDNCARENKNRYLLAFFTWLVEIDVFKKVKINFLMVGHTHEDVDQVFSRFSTWLSRYAVFTLPHLLQAFEKCYTPNPVSIETDTVFNISEWLGPNIEKLQGHSRPHCFKIQKDCAKTKLFYKAWSTDKQWHDATATTPLLKYFPVGEPRIVKPSLDEVDLKKVEESVNSSIAKQFIRKQEDIEWWQSFFNTLGEPKATQRWPNLKLLKKSQEEETTEVELESSEDLEKQDVNVVVGKRKQQQASKPSCEVGDMVLTDVPRYAGEWPQVAEIKEVSGTCIKIHWYKGSKTTSWTPCTIPVPGEKGKRQSWIEEIDVSEIWHYSFRLTPSGHLPKKVKELVEIVDN